MQKALSFTFLSLFLAISAHTQPTCNLAKNCLKDTQKFSNEITRPLWVFNLEAQGLTCSKTNEIFECVGKTKCSAEAVHFFGNENLKTPTQMHMHFHGHNLGGMTATAFNFNKVSGNGDYAAFLKKSEAPVLLVVPESLGKGETFTTLTQNAKSTTDFFKCVKDISASSVTKVSLSSHSGSDRILEKILSQQKTPPNEVAGLKIKGLGLFDSLYEQDKAIPELFALKQNAIYPFWNVFVKGGSTQHNQNVFARVPSSATYKEYAIQNSEHMEIMRKGNFSGFLKAVSE